MKKSKRKGKSHSTRPITTISKWVKYTPEEVESLVVELAKKGIPPSQIGIILRDQYGIPLVRQITGKRICEILEERKLLLAIPEDLNNLIKRASRARRHLEEHPKDMSSKRGLQLIESKINRLAKYYISIGRLPSDWKYVPEKVSILSK
ncbi:MAG: 30S ribosomal protein S15 [Candidatus Verstraetearchaeota archaeon]|nr:30S ribosomal protein S15 [Candidatus Verstraetearchaeota archaeon]